MKWYGLYIDGELQYVKKCAGIPTAEYFGVTSNTLCDIKEITERTDGDKQVVLEVIKILPEPSESEILKQAITMVHAAIKDILPTYSTDTQEKVSKIISLVETKIIKTK